MLRDPHDHFRGRIVAVWDGGKVHHAAAKRVQSNRPETVTRPGYAPELNPAEHLWNRLKWVDRANVAPLDSDERHGQLQPLREQTADSASRLASFWKGASLPIQKAKLQE